MNSGHFRPPRPYTEKVQPFYNMRTTSVDAGSGEFTWCIFLVLALLPLYPDISIIDPFHDSPYNFSFHNFSNRLTWPPRRLQMGAKQPPLRNYYGFPLSPRARRTMLCLKNSGATGWRALPSRRVFFPQGGEGRNAFV